MWGYDHKKEEYFSIPFQFIDVHFPGTGDHVLRRAGGGAAGRHGFPGRGAPAMDVLETLIDLEKDEIEKNKGIRIEKFLDVLKH